MRILHVSVVSIESDQFRRFFGGKSNFKFLFDVEFYVPLRAECRKVRVRVKVYEGTLV